MVPLNPTPLHASHFLDPPPAPQTRDDEKFSDRETFELIPELPQVHVLQVKLDRIFLVLQLSLWDIVADRLPRVGLSQLVLVKSAHSLGMSFPNQIPRSR